MRRMQRFEYLSGMVAKLWATAVLVTACGISAAGGGDGGAAPAPSTEQCVFAPRAGSARGTARPTVNDPYESFAYSEAQCVTMHRRDGSFDGYRFQFGTYDPATPSKAPALVIEPIVYLDGPVLANAPSGGELVLPSGTRVSAGGMLTFDRTTHHGELHDPYALVSIMFDCDPADELSGDPIAPAPAHPAPGTAIVTRTPSEAVVVLDGLRCVQPPDRELELERIDHGPDCSFSQLALQPLGSQPILGAGTYPQYYYGVSAILTQGNYRIVDGAHDIDGSLDISEGPPWTGFATFSPGANSSPDVVEFSCQE